MKRASLATMVAFLAASFFLSACSGGKADPKGGGAAAVTVEHEQDVNVFQVEHAEQFPLSPRLSIFLPRSCSYCTVSPDISRSVPVISLATGRVVEVHARLGDSVQKGQVLLRVQSADMSAAFSDYRKAVADEKLAKIQFDRAKLLYDKGAISLNEFETAEDVETRLGRLETHGAAARSGATSTTPLLSWTSALRFQVLSQINRSPMPRRGRAGLAQPIHHSDLSNVWILCDVYENDLPTCI